MHSIFTWVEEDELMASDPESEWLVDTQGTVFYFVLLFVSLNTLQSVFDHFCGCLLAYNHFFTGRYPVGIDLF